MAYRWHFQAAVLGESPLWSRSRARLLWIDTLRGSLNSLYVTDSRRGVIYGYDNDPGSGEVSNRREVISIHPKKGKPDGLIVDQHGFLLSVLFDGAAIARISPQGEIERWIHLPVQRPTSCTFADDDRYLYVTSARLGLSETLLETMPYSGALLRIDYRRALER